MYGARYAGKPGNLQRPLVSPGSTCNQDWWANAAPSNGFYVTYGSEEVFAAEIRRWVRTLRQAAVGVRVDEEPGAVHAWLIARLFLENTQEARAKGMKDLVRAVAANVGTGTKLKV